ncbi:MAG: hypothetical protein O2955_00420 [Planctomycetota bacterium]|nr:hypothetical protein [Planctomycetota bacterium]MDA1210945.1 hypothetical protein [Planctomycetota bacterium]
MVKVRGHDSPGSITEVQGQQWPCTGVAREDSVLIVDNVLIAERTETPDTLLAWAGIMADLIVVMVITPGDAVCIVAGRGVITVITGVDMACIAADTAVITVITAGHEGVIADITIITAAGAVAVRDTEESTAIIGVDTI